MSPVDEQLAAYYREACALDVETLKPGNVSVDAPAHDMTAADFMKSARVTAPMLTNRSLALGERIIQAIEATRAAVGCNTNLGIVLLCAPLIAAAQREGSSLRDGLAQTLAALTPEDSAAVYGAIRLASPGGLGNAEEADVNQDAPPSLLHGMQLASDRDTIALQYVSGYRDVFELGVSAIETALTCWPGKLKSAVQWCYLVLLSEHVDSHVVRKHGEARGVWLRDRAREVASLVKSCQNPGDFAPPLVAFDQEIKGAKVNPGTTADLTVASVLAWRLSGSKGE